MKSMPKVIIDIGHLECDSGAVANGLREDLLNKYVASYVIPELERHNVTVVVTTGSLQNRVDVEHKERPNYFISLHTNAGGGDGMEVFCYSKGGESERLARLIHDEIVGANLNNSRGVKTANYMVLRETWCPACLVETAFIDRLEDIQCIDEAHEQQAFGIAIAKGILKALGIEYVPQVTKTHNYYVQTQIFEGWYDALPLYNNYLTQSAKLYPYGVGVGQVVYATQYLPLETCQSIVNALQADGIGAEIIEE